MTDREDGKGPSASPPDLPDAEESQVAAWVARALADEMIPTELGEVAEQEAAALPENVPPLPLIRPQSADSSPLRSSPLRSLPPRSSPPRSSPLQRRKSLSWSPRAPVWQLASAAALGALAAAGALLILFPREVTPITLSGAGSERVPTSPDEPADAEPLNLSASCEACCAGSACRDNAETCASGRACVPCQPSGEGRYRLRLGDLAWSDTAGGELEQKPWVCVQAPRTPEDCIGTSQPGTAPWQVTGRAYTPSDLLSGMTIRLRDAKTRQELAVYRRKIAVTKETLCKGLSVSLGDGHGAALATLSAFLDDAQFVEIERAARPAVLLEHAANLTVQGTALALYETTGEGDRKFALTIGPLDVGRAERVRWALLEADRPAVVTLGDDHVGAPRLIP